MNINNSTIETAVKFLTQGKLVAFPTETVYGLGGDARNNTAIQKIFEAKGRPSTNPLIIHLSDISAIQAFAQDIPESAYSLAAAFWPGPLTLVLKKHPSVLMSVTGGQNSVALRIPNHPVALSLLNLFKEGIAAPSANRYGGISPTRPEHVRKSLGSRVDYILEADQCSVGIESTIVSLLDDYPVILRQGHIKAYDIEKVLNIKNKVLETSHSEIEVPGLSLKHYSPTNSLFLLEARELKNKIIELILNHTPCSVVSITLSKQIFFEELQKISEFNTTLLNTLSDNITWITLANDPVRYAHAIYASLHELDQYSNRNILLELPPLRSDWNAVHDRLRRAAK